jgi:uncharacterized membrane protein
MKLGRILLGALYVGAGVLHFVATSAYERIMPPYLPDHRGLVLLSGAFEIAGGVGVLIPQTRRFAAWGLIALLIAVMPANVQMALDHGTKWRSIPEWMLWSRLPIQLPLIWWAWLYTRQ